MSSYQDSSSLSNGITIRPVTGNTANWTQGLQIPSPPGQRGACDDSMFLFDDINMPTLPGSIVSDREETQFNFGSLQSIDEASQMTSYSQVYNTVQQQQTRMDLQPAPSQLTNFTPSNTMPVNNRMSLLSQHLKGQGYAQAYDNPVVTSPAINRPSFPHSVGRATCSPMHHFMRTSLNINEQDQYTPLKFDDDLDLLLLSPGPEVTSPASDWQFDQSQTHDRPIGIPSTNKRGASFSSSSRPQHHPYRSPTHGGAAESIFSLGTSFIDHVAKNFSPHQQQAALDIFNYKQAHPDTAIPSSLITPDLAEVQEGRGWCLIGNCGIDRSKQRLNLQYDIRRDTTRKRLDYLYDHIRDEHFNSRPFRCAITLCMQAFSREHDLKRHEKTHAAVSLPCDFCGKLYTREDNLKRHMQVKHMSATGTSRGFGGASLPY